MRLIAKPLRSGIFQKVGGGLKEAENRLIFENGRTPERKTNPARRNGSYDIVADRRAEYRGWFSSVIGIGRISAPRTSDRRGRTEEYPFPLPLRKGSEANRLINEASA